MSVGLRPSSIAEATLTVDGMDCASCVTHVEKAAKKVAGVSACSVNLALGKAVVRFDSASTSVDAIAHAITHAGYPSKPKDLHTDSATAEQQRLLRRRLEARAWFRRAMLGLALWFPIELSHWLMYVAGAVDHGGVAQVNWMTWLALAAGTVAMVFIGSAFFRSAFKSLRAGTTNMDVLISMGAGTAYFYSLVALIGHLSRGWPLAHLYFMESAGLLALISLGHWLEARARESAGSAIRQLMNLTPATARLLLPPPCTPGGGQGEGRRRLPMADCQWPIENASFNPKSEIRNPKSQNPPPGPLPEYQEGEKEVPVSNLNIGDHILIKPGDRIPIDGVVYAGRSNVDEAMITGEPLPVARGAGDAVIGGTLNIDGALRVKVSKIGSETALAQIIKLVEDAQTSKPQVQKLADRISAVFVPSVLGIALLTGIGWYLHGKAVGLESAALWGKLANAVCSVLIIACPCALGLAVPAAMMVGTGRGAQRGILIRDIDALQHAEHIGIVVLDKTGTITAGRPFVRGIYVDYSSTSALTENDLLSITAAAAQNSAHPLAQAIVGAARRLGLSLPEAQQFVDEPGRGVKALVDGKTVIAGNAQLLTDAGAAPIGMGESIAATSDGLSVVMVAIDGRFVGHVELGDDLKPDSIRAVESLRSAGLNILLLSGDNESAARKVAAAAGIDDVRANVSPGGKAAIIRELQGRQSAIGTRPSKVCMVGDGINDAPALAAADLGIAIGSGSDIAKEAGDIVLVSGSLTGVPAAIKLSRATMRKIRQNLFFAFIYNVLAIPLAAFGLLDPMIAAGAMALSDVTVIGNALLLKRAKID